MAQIGGRIADSVASVLADEPDLTVPRLMKALRGRGHARLTRSLLERTLDRDARFVDDGGGLKARWRVDEAKQAAPKPMPRGDRPLDGLGLRDWQIEAFATWAGAGCTGVIEAITGSGKTRLAVAAVRACLWQEGTALVLVPTLDLLDQWVGTLRALVPDVRVGKLGGGGDADLHDHRVVVATVHAAAAVPIDPPGGGPALLVADEAHRYGAPTWGAALRPEFSMRLALTATYERNDDGLVDVVGPYFGSVVYQYGYQQAAADGVIADFDVALVGVDLTEQERAVWTTADRAVKRSYRRLVDHGLPRDPRRLLPAAATMVAEASNGGRAAKDPVVAAASEYLARIRARRDVAADASAKMTVLRTIAPLLEGSRTLVFCDTVDQAERACSEINRAEGPLAETVHGGLDAMKRRIRLAQFKNGALPIVAAPRVLDEGVDVPDADVAVVLAAFRNRRQMVQRLGRVLRIKPDGRSARLVIVSARGTGEDPGQGAHAVFLDEVLDVAGSIEHLAGDSDAALTTWFAGG